METTLIKVSYNMWVQDFSMGKERRLRGTDTQLISTVYQFCEISTIITVSLFNGLFFFNITTAYPSQSHMKGMIVLFL